MVLGGNIWLRLVKFNGFLQFGQFWATTFGANSGEYLQSLRILDRTLLIVDRFFKFGRTWADLAGIVPGTTCKPGGLGRI